jgi:tetratricopeptide (TPR) repeat protein
MEALDLPHEARAACLAACCQDTAQRSEAERLLRACERAATSAVLDSPAPQFAAPVLTEVLSESLRSALAERYLIERELGRGGQATVYLARDERHGRLVALKVLKPTLLREDDSSQGARFQREIAFAARLSHPHILPLYDSGAAAGRLYYVTPYVDGESLRDRLTRIRRLPLDQAVRVLRDVARALAHAHRQGVVHRDIKPANILLNQEGDALVSDFGVAKALDGAELTDGALVLGTPAYMAPEQAGGGPAIDHRADLYSFGVVAYELLTGATPFAGRNRHELLAAHLAEVPRPIAASQPELPPALATLVDRLLAKRPVDRPRDAAEVVALLDAAVASPASVVKRGTANPDAYEFYLKGRYLYNTRQRDGLLRALQYFEHAVALDAAYARAYAAIADTYTMLGVGGHVEPRDALSKGRAAAERAIALDNRLAEGHAALAHQLFVCEWKWEAAGQAFERAIALDPRDSTGRMYYAAYLHSIGRCEDALAQLNAAQALDPLAPTGLLSGRVYVDTHRPDAAIRVLQELVDLDPRRDLAHQLLAHAYLQKHMPAEAIASMQRAAALSGARDAAQLAYIYAATGDHGEARRILGRLVVKSRLELLGFHIAMAYAALGDVDEAFRWLDRAYERHGSFMNLLAVTTGFDSVRADPRFSDLLRRMGLAAVLGRA